MKTFMLASAFMFSLGLVVGHIVAADSIPAAGGAPAAAVAQTDSAAAAPAVTAGATNSGVSPDWEKMAASPRFWLGERVVVGICVLLVIFFAGLVVHKKRKSIRETRRRTS